MPLHIFSQQLMALALQLGGIGAADWRAWIGRLPPFAAIDAEKEAEILRYLQERGILFGDSGLLGLGQEGEARYGRRHFLELLSVFSSPAMLAAFHGTRELGLVEAGFLVTTQAGASASIALGGKSWTVQHVDWRARRVFVEPSSDRGRGAWIGRSQGLSHHLAKAAQTVLVGDVASSLWSTRAAAAMERIRGEFSHVRTERNTLAVFAGGRRTEWFTFAGARTNEILAQHLHRTHSFSAQPGDFSISFPEGTSLTDLQRAITELTSAAVAEGARFDDDEEEALKFHECLPVSLRQEVLRRRFVNQTVLGAFLANTNHTVLVVD